MTHARRIAGAAAAVFIALTIPGSGHAQTRISWERLSYWVEAGPIASIPQLLREPYCYDFTLTEGHTAQLRSRKQGNPAELAELDRFLRQVQREVCPDLLAPSRADAVTDDGARGGSRVRPTGLFLGAYGFMPIRDPDQVNTGSGGGVKVGHAWSNNWAVVAGGRLAKVPGGTYDRLTRDLELLGGGRFPVLHPVMGVLEFGGVYSNEEYATSHFDRLGVAGGVGLGVRLPYSLELEVEFLEQLLWTTRATVDGSEVGITEDQPIGRFRMSAGIVWYPRF